MLIFLAIVLSLIPHDMMYGPQAALIAKSFTGKLRYSGASLGYQLASDHCRRAGTDHRDLVVREIRNAVMRLPAIFSRALSSRLIATAMMTEYAGKDIEGDYE